MNPEHIKVHIGNALDLIQRSVKEEVRSMTITEEAIIELLDKADDRTLDLIWRFVRGILGGC